MIFMVNLFNTKKIDFPLETILIADIHGNLSGFRAVLSDIRVRHRERIGDALIGTIDPASKEGRDMKKMLTYIHKKHKIIDDSRIVKTHNKIVYDNAKRKFQDSITQWEAKLPKSKIVCLGDFLGYYLQTREVLEEVRNNADQVCLGNHEKNILKASIAPGLSEDVLRRYLGTGPYPTKTTRAVVAQLGQDDLNYLKSLPETIRIREDIVGRHCHYQQQTPMYAISEKLASQHGYFRDPSKIKKFCFEPEDIYDKSDTFIEDDLGKVIIEVEAHSHLPVYYEFDENGDLKMDLVPGDVEIGSGDKKYLLRDFRLIGGHTALWNPGSVGISRRNDTFVRDKASEIHGSGVRIKQAYYGSVIEGHLQNREIWYDINSTGTLAQTLALGVPLRDEDKEWENSYVDPILDKWDVVKQDWKPGTVLTNEDYQWFCKDGLKILGARAA